MRPWQVHQGQDWEVEVLLENGSGMCAPGKQTTANVSTCQVRSGTSLIRTWKTEVEGRGRVDLDATIPGAALGLIVLKTYDYIFFSAIFLLKLQSWTLKPRSNIEKSSTRNTNFNRRASSVANVPGRSGSGASHSLTVRGSSGILSQDTTLCRNRNSCSKWVHKSHV